ncbi:MAG: molybdenum cofactor guanylyltransferase [Desulfobacteraceae bacterium]|nr:molybdenum cofactor guanylyltransferase [Desulfobacteraceae bacterium]
MEAWNAKSRCCAVILAGGRNTRMLGRNKAFLTIDGRTLLERLLETLSAIFKEIVLVTREPELYAHYPLQVVEDIFEARSSLTGIHAGLKFGAADYCFVVPCDAPLLKPELVHLLLSEIEPAVDAVIPFIGGYYEPLCAIYSKRCIAPIEAQLERGDFQIIRIFGSLNVKKVEEEKIKRVDPQLHSFLNINTPEAFESLKALIRPSKI